MIELLVLSLILGIIAGTFTGLTPGIHINLVSTLLLSFLIDKNLLNKTSLPLIVFITSMSITHTFIDFFPSIFLGAPEEDNFLSVLPGHQLLNEGRGQEAVILTLYGSLIAIPLILLITPIFILFLPTFFETIRAIIPFILIFASLYLILREQKIFLSASVFLLSGLVGFLTFNLPIKQPLLPLLTGLFGLSSLIISLNSETDIPKQIILPLREIKLTKTETIKSIFSASVAAPFCSFLPGIGSGHAAVISSEISSQTRKSFLFLVGIINTLVMGLSFVTLYVIGKSRTGSAAIIGETLNNILPSTTFSIILTTITLSGILAFLVGIILSKTFPSILNKISYRKLNIFVIFILILIVLLFSNLLGFLVLLTSAALGIFTIESGSRRIQMMGCLLIPSIIYYLF